MAARRDDQHAARDRDDHRAQKEFRIRLRYLGTEFVLDHRERSSATIGRGEENDLVIKGNLISRLHARIEAGKKFMLVDQSTNGTFVQAQNGEEAFVRREAMPLKGTGMIGLGRVPEPQSQHTVEFVCEDGPVLAAAGRVARLKPAAQPRREPRVQFLDSRRSRAGRRAP